MRKRERTNPVSLLPANGPPLVQISLVADNCDFGVASGELLDEGNPFGEALECLLVRYVVDEENSLSSAVILLCDRLETLLPSRVPQIFQILCNCTFYFPSRIKPRLRDHLAFELKLFVFDF